MSETEKILMSESGVKAYEGEHPPSVGLKAGAFADTGTIILTNQRFVYINKGGGARAATYVIGGALAAWAVEKEVSKAQLDDAVKYPGSYSIPLEDICKVETARHMGSAYLRIDNKNPCLKPAHSFILGSGFSKDQDWVNAINSAIVAARAPEMNPTPSTNPQQMNIPPIDSTSIPPPPQPVQSTDSFMTPCPSCGAVPNHPARFCICCGAPLELPRQVAPSNIKPKFCENCGSPVALDARFCESCGTKTSE